MAGRALRPATRRSTALQGETGRPKHRTALLAACSQLASRLRRWWQVLGSCRSCSQI